MDASLDVDMVDTAGHALADGVSAYVAAYVRPERLLDGVPDLFQAIGLLLKERLELVNPLGLRDQPNNPTVLERFADAGVVLAPDETELVTRLRRLRNNLQHSSARFNHRATLARCRRALIFIDRLVEEELHAWAGDLIAPDAWHQLLAIEEIRARAMRVVGGRIQPYREDPEATVTTCARCSAQTMLRPHPNTGASCVLCGHIPVQKDS